jgi:hypothetical protein
MMDVPSNRVRPSPLVGAPDTCLGLTPHWLQLQPLDLSADVASEERLEQPEPALEWMSPRTVNRVPPGTVSKRL